MIMDYSKTLGDLTSEEASRSENELALIERQKKATQRLLGAPPRESCILRVEPLRGQQFLHQKIHYCLVRPAVTFRPRFSLHPAIAMRQINEEDFRTFTNRSTGLNLTQRGMV